MKSGIDFARLMIPISEIDRELIGILKLTSNTYLERSSSSEVRDGI